MSPLQRRQTILGMLLGAMCLGAWLHVRGLSSALQLGNAETRGILLLPSLPTPLYITMAFVVLAGVGLTLLASLIQRRRQPPESQKHRESEPIKPPWQLLVSMIASGTVLILSVLWLTRYGAHMRQWWEHWSHKIRTTPEFLATGTQSLLRQINSPIAGYALFATVLIVYGGLGLLGLWVLCTDRNRVLLGPQREEPRTRRVRRAVTAGLRELHQHADPRQAIIACYARLEHLLEDHGVPAYCHLTPQEYMGAALQGLDLPMDAFAGLVALFEQARYSLHPLDDTSRKTAITHLETLKTHLEWRATLATHS